MLDTESLETYFQIHPPVCLETIRETRFCRSGNEMQYVWSPVLRTTHKPIRVNVYNLSETDQDSWVTTTHDQIVNIFLSDHWASASCAHLDNCVHQVALQHTPLKVLELAGKSQSELCRAHIL